MIRKSYAALRNLATSLPNPNLDPNPDPNISGQVESESEKKRLGSASLTGTHESGNHVDSFDEKISGRKSHASAR